MIVKSGATDVTTYFVLRDSTAHAPKTNITITDIDLYYVKSLTAISAKADATALAAADSAHADSKAYHIGQGVYRVDWPDAAFSGAVGTLVTLLVVCSEVDTTFLEVELSPATDSATIADAVWDEARSGHTASGSFGDVAVAADLADAVWDEALSGHSTAGTSGVALSTASTGGVDAGALADAMWGETLPGAYGSGTAGKLVGDNLNAPVATVDTVVDAIKAKTDLLPASPAAVGSAMTLAVNAIGTAALSDAAVDKILDEVIEGSYTLRQILRGLASASMGKMSGGGTDTVAFRDLADTMNRIVARVDITGEVPTGNREAVTLSLT